MDKSELRDAWRSFCTDYASKEPESRHVIHKYVDACSGPAVLKLISAATAEKKVKLVHPASITDPEALNKITVVHPKLLSKIDEEDFDIESFDNDEMGDENFDIDSFVMDDDFHIGHFDIDWHDFAYMIDLDKSTFEIYDPQSTKPVCKYTFADLERLTEAEFIGRYYKDIEEEEDPDNTPQYRFLLAGSFGRHSHKTITSELAGKFQFCSTVGDRPTHLVCTQREYYKKNPMKKVRDAWEHGTPICDAKILLSQAMEADVENYILWPKHESS
ncbi:hypothetical protein V3481_017295 [Fusarium oxysporum f. sp. vasinfectum]